MKRIFLLIFGFILLNNTGAYAQNMPAPTLKRQHYNFLGEWVHIKSYCENWSEDQKESRYNQLKDHFFHGYLYVNLWEAKFIDSTLKNPDQELPYEFCRTTILFEPHSINNTIVFRFVENGGDTDCSQPFSQLYNDKMIMNYHIRKKAMGQEDLLLGRLENTQFCEGGRLNVVYKSKGRH